MFTRNTYGHTFDINKVEVIDLVNDVPLKSTKPKVVDLTNTEPEVIVLDDTISRFDRSLNVTEIVISDVDDSCIDLINYNNQPKANFYNLNRGDESNINFKSVNSLCTLNREILLSERNNKNICTNGSAQLIKKRRRKVENILEHNNTFTNVNRSGLKSIKKKSTNKIGSLNKDSKLLQLNRNITTRKSKKKLIDVSNISNICQSPKPLPDHLHTYYKNVDKVVKKLSKNSKKNVIHRNSNSKTKKKDFRVKDTSIVINKVNKIKPTSTKKKLKRKKQQKFKEKVKCEFVDNRNSGRKIVFKPRNNLVGPFRENNIYNPNPYEVDNEGFRPIVIDGSNIAIGHGRGKFSVKGVKICVDYFANTGHKHVKVFLPQFRKQLFPEDMLDDLQNKCDMVFTPSSDINGVRRTPYDDRFIVQYAVEFGGIIVSTDNYRDLLKENPRWQETIKSRLLMFTWVDDFLMFPLDPLGRTGPSLEQFLRF